MASNPTSSSKASNFPSSPSSQNPNKDKKKKKKKTKDLERNPSPRRSPSPDPKSPERSAAEPEPEPLAKAAMAKDTTEPSRKRKAKDAILENPDSRPNAKPRRSPSPDPERPENSAMSNDPAEPSRKHKSSKSKNADSHRSPSPVPRSPEKPTRPSTRSSTKSKDPEPSPNPNYHHSPSPNLKSHENPAKPSAMAEPSRKRKPKDEDYQEDTLTILDAIVQYRAVNGGSVPTPSTIEPFFKSIKDTLHIEITADQLYNKFRTMKHRYRELTAPGSVGPSTPFDQMFVDLSTRAWGGMKKPSSNKGEKKGKKLKVEENGDAGLEAGDDDGEDDAFAAADDDDSQETKENGDAGGSFWRLIDEARKYWSKLGLPTQDLEEGLARMDEAEAAALEQKWKLHNLTGMQLEAEAHQVTDKVVSTLVSVQKGASS